MSFGSDLREAPRWISEAVIGFLDRLVSKAHGKLTVTIENGKATYVKWEQGFSEKEMEGDSASK
jgi:hypothetical protein